MKTLIVVLGLSIATPVLACPGMEGHDEAPRTAEQGKDKKETEKPAPKDTAKKDAPKKDAPKPAETPKTAQK